MLWSALLACSPDLTPAWVVDPIWLEPSGDGGVHGFETWQVYGPKGEDHRSARFYVCGVVVELAGEAVECDAEPGCAHAWSMVTEPVESDCEGDLADTPLFVSLERLAVGGEASGEDVPWPGLTSVGWVDHGRGWEQHGDEYAAALDEGGSGELAWNDRDPYVFVPTTSIALP